MPTPDQTLIDLEKRFWQSMVDQDIDAALQLLSEPAFMISPHGTIKFDHAGYREMSEHGPMLVTSFELNDIEVVLPNETTAILTYRVKQGVTPRGGGSATVQEMNDTSTWIHDGKNWLCVMHTETPAEEHA